MTARRRTRSRALVAVVVAAVAAGVAIAAVEAPLASVVYRIPVAISLLLAVALGAAIPLGIARPRIAIALATTAVATGALLAEPTATAPWPVSAGATVGFALVVLVVGSRAPWSVGAVGWFAANALVLIISTVRETGEVEVRSMVAILIVFATVGLAAYGMGALVRGRQIARRQLAAERELTAAETARRELAEERTRIARELHDIVAHGMSAIQVQAVSAPYRIPSLDAAASAEFADIAATARTAIGEMRRLLDVLRADDEADTAPQPGLGDLADLFVRPAHGGALEVDDRLGDGDIDDPIIGLTVYRSVQESLSNIARHAPGAAATVILQREGQVIALTVANGPAPRIRSDAAAAHDVDRGGHGLRGMRERVALVGGTMRAGPTVDGGFEVRVRIPLTKED